MFILTFGPCTDSGKNLHLFIHKQYRRQKVVLHISLIEMSKQKNPTNCERLEAWVQPMPRRGNCSKNLFKKNLL